MFERARTNTSVFSVFGLLWGKLSQETSRSRSSQRIVSKEHCELVGPDILCESLPHNTDVGGLSG